LSVSIGYGAGNSNQSPHCIAIGGSAGHTEQKQNSISIGTFAGQTNQGENSIAIGYFAGYESQGENSIAIGVGAGQTKQGKNSIAIGNGTGKIEQSDCSILINASGGDIDVEESGFYVAPIRCGSYRSKLSRLFYDIQKKEVVYIPEYTFVKEEGMYRIQPDMKDGDSIKIINISNGVVDVWCMGVKLATVERRDMIEVIAVKDTCGCNDLSRDDFIVFYKTEK
jgi:hypothetical protein